MPYICSIILVLNSFDVRIGKEDILFKKEVLFSLIKI
ncbi:hypothetical protein BANRA_04647 [Escherichia coli]|nr:hypothetical protein BANRA_03298 [Escherichia coli]VCY20729.1 hypothetical protein BANRA_03539 [Escherichia coli]VDA81223.1 hypothetical protein BANRA_00648 [Escherichia coli]VDA96340.1 hypothetical protein BANRA_04647 [Escherichia coli]